MNKWIEDDCINVGLYSTMSKKDPARAELVHCLVADRCSLYQEGVCYGITAPFSDTCKNAEKRIVKGYTTRAKKYSDFIKKYKDHEQYNKLSYPVNNRLGITDKEVIFSYPHFSVVFDEKSNTYKLDNPLMFGTSLSYLPIEHFNVGFIYRFCTFKPQAMMGGIIRSFELEVVPRFLNHVKDLLPELYNRFVREYPEFDKATSVGRKAYLVTLEPCIVEVEKCKWDWDGKYLTLREESKNKFKPFPFDMEKRFEAKSIVLKPREHAVIEVESEDQVGENTVFVD